MSAITPGFSTIVPAWKPNSSTTVAIRPTTDQGLSLATNCPTAVGDFLTSICRVIMPASNGSTTYSTVESSNVSQGTVTLVTPSRKAAIGAKAKTMIRSFTDTCTRV